MARGAVGAVFTLLLGCAPERELGDCLALERGLERDECLALRLPDGFRQDPDGSARLVEAEIADPLVRDFVYLRVAQEIDPVSGRWCGAIAAAAVAERCLELARRPHLHRRLGVVPPPPAPGPGAVPPPGGLPGSDPGS